LGSTRKTQGILEHHQANNREVSPIKLHQPNKVAPPKAKGAKPDSSSGSTSYSIK